MDGIFCVSTLLLMLFQDVFRFIVLIHVPTLEFSNISSICPPMFKVISNFGSNATSLPLAGKYIFEVVTRHSLCPSFPGLTNFLVFRILRVELFLVVHGCICLYWHVLVNSYCEWFQRRNSTWGPVSRSNWKDSLGDSNWSVGDMVELDDCPRNHSVANTVSTPAEYFPIFILWV